MVIYYISPTENFCEGDKIDEFEFEKTPVGWFAYSDKQCGTETVNGEFRIDVSVWVFFCVFFFCSNTLVFLLWPPLFSLSWQTNGFNQMLTKSRRLTKFWASATGPQLWPDTEWHTTKCKKFSPIVPVRLRICFDFSLLGFNFCFSKISATIFYPAAHQPGRLGGARICHSNPDLWTQKADAWKRHDSRWDCQSTAAVAKCHRSKNWWPESIQVQRVDPTVKKLNPQRFCRTSGWQQ